MRKFSYSEYYNVIPPISTHKISLVPHRPYSILLLHFGASTHCNSRSLFIEIFGWYSAQILMLSHRGYFTSEFPSQLSPLSWCLAHDFSILKGFSWLLSLMDLGSRFPYKEGFLTRLSSICCTQLKSQNMLSCLFYFHGSTLVLWFSCILDIFFYIHCKTKKKSL